MLVFELNPRADEPLTCWPSERAPLCVRLSICVWLFCASASARRSAQTYTHTHVLACARARARVRSLAKATGACARAERLVRTAVYYTTRYPNLPAASQPTASPWPFCARVCVRACVRACLCARADSCRLLQLRITSGGRLCAPPLAAQAATRRTRASE